MALLNKAPRAATIVAAPSRAGSGSGADRLKVATLSDAAFTRLLGPLTGIMGRHARENYGPGFSGGGEGFPTGAGAAGGPSAGLAATDFSQIAPHEVAPQASATSNQPGGGTWIGGLGASPFS